MAQVIESFLLTTFILVFFSTSVEMTNDVYFWNSSYLYIITVSELENKGKRNTW
jgi:hypothetical protein